MPGWGPGGSLTAGNQELDLDCPTYEKKLNKAAWVCGLFKVVFLRWQGNRDKV